MRGEFDVVGILTRRRSAGETGRSAIGSMTTTSAHRDIRSWQQLRLTNVTSQSSDFELPGKSAVEQHREPTTPASIAGNINLSVDLGKAQCEDVAQVSAACESGA